MELQKQSATDVEQSAASEPAVKAIDLEHHFYIPEFVEFVKARKEYPIWQDGFGIYFSKNAVEPPGPPFAKIGLNYIKDNPSENTLT